MNAVVAAFLLSVRNYARSKEVRDQRSEVGDRRSEDGEGGVLLLISDLRSPILISDL